jgi:hypothetical protein|tara:strand:- start:1842 stop:2042 length:201 start_codon:yes stop_codon:yes gene_type:complete
VQDNRSLIRQDNQTLLETHLVEEILSLINIERLRLQTISLLHLMDTEIRLPLVVEEEAEVASLQVQ